MAVQRIEWQCPGCQRKFAIPNQQPRPKLCPNCLQNAAASPQKRPASPAYSSPSPEEPEVAFADYPVDPPPRLPASQPLPARPVKRRRYEELRTLSLVLKILAAMIGIITFVVLAELGMNVMDVPPGPLRRMAVYYCFGVLLGGTTTALLVYAFAVLLLVALDVEFNTRQD